MKRSASYSKTAQKDAYTHRYTHKLCVVKMSAAAVGLCVMDQAK